MSKREKFKEGFKPHFKRFYRHKFVMKKKIKSPQLNLFKTLTFVNFSFYKFKNLEEYNDRIIFLFFLLLNTFYRFKNKSLFVRQ